MWSRRDSSRNKLLAILVGRISPGDRRRQIKICLRCPLSRYRLSEGLSLTNHSPDRPGEVRRNKKARKSSVLSCLPEKKPCLIWLARFNNRVPQKSLTSGIAKGDES